MWLERKGTRMAVKELEITRLGQSSGLQLPEKMPPEKLLLLFTCWIKNIVTRHKRILLAQDGALLLHKFLITYFLISWIDDTFRVLRVDDIRFFRLSATAGPDGGHG